MMSIPGKLLLLFVVSLGGAFLTTSAQAVAAEDEKARNLTAIKSALMKALPLLESSARTSMEKR